MKYLFTLLLIGSFLTSCVSLPSFKKTSQNTDISISNASSQIEALKRDEYEVLKTTTGKASSSQFYILFIPIGQHKTQNELYENAYANAVENLKGADGLILPRTKNKKVYIPLVLVNYSKRQIEVSGLGISVKNSQAQNVSKVSDGAKIK